MKNGSRVDSVWERVLLGKEGVHREEGVCKRALQVGE